MGHVLEGCISFLILLFSFCFLAALTEAAFLCPGPSSMLLTKQTLGFLICEPK